MTGQSKVTKMAVSERKFLHVGCGQATKAETTLGFQTATWREIRVDIDPTVDADIHASMTDLSQVADGGVDAVFTSHAIEHLWAHEVPVALGEFFRVLSPTGFVVVTCPDLKAVALVVAEGGLLTTLYDSPAGPIAALDILYGHRVALAAGKAHMAHRTGFTRGSLLGALGAAGFARGIAVRRPAYFDLWALATKHVVPPEGLAALGAIHFPPGAKLDGVLELVKAPPG